MKSCCLAVFPIPWCLASQFLRMKFGGFGDEWLQCGRHGLLEAVYSRLREVGKRCLSRPVFSLDELSIHLNVGDEGQVVSSINGLTNLQGTDISFMPGSNTEIVYSTLP